MTLVIRKCKSDELYDFNALNKAFDDLLDTVKGIVEDDKQIKSMTTQTFSAAAATAFLSMCAFICWQHMMTSGVVQQPYAEFSALAVMGTVFSMVLFLMLYDTLQARKRYITFLKSRLDCVSGQGENVLDKVLAEKKIPFEKYPEADYISIMVKYHDLKRVKSLLEKSQNFGFKDIQRTDGGYEIIFSNGEKEFMDFATLFFYPVDILDSNGKVSMELRDNRPI